MASCYLTARLVIFVVVFLFINEIAQFCLCANSTNTLVCIETERQALLKFKQSFKKDPSSSRYRLSSWKGNHCCQWEGVGCNFSTAHVIKLDISSKDIDDVLETQGVINSSLQELEYLSYLDLSGNNFQATPIPMFFGSLKQLRYLNLSSSQFGGRVPINLGNLTNLRVLDLSTVYSSGQLQLFVDDIDWISQLSSLPHLDMSGVSLLKAKNLMQVLNMLPSLLQLRLHDCGLDDIHVGNDFQNVTSIRVLDLSSNDIHLVPLWFGKLKNLEYVNLASNSLSGPIPNVFQNMTDSIRELELSDNSFDSVPLWFGKLISLVHLNLAFNRLKGPFPKALQNMTDIRILDVSHNNLSSSIPMWLSTFKRLVHVNLASNNFTSIEGSLTPILRDNCELKSLVVSENNFHGEAFGQHSRGQGNSSGCIRYDLEELDLSTNKFNGSLPSWLGQFKNLKLLDLDWNAFYGPIPPSIGNLSNLTRLDLSENDLSGTIPDNFGQLVNVQIMDLSNNNLSGMIPDSLGQLVNIQTLDLSHNSLNEVSLESFGNVKLQIMDFSYNSLKGTISAISKWFSRRVQTSYLDISSNLINGTIPENIGYMMPLQYLLVADNKIEGSIPNSLCEIETLYILDLSRNKLSGSIPNCVWKGNSLDLIDLSFNELTGGIPNSIGNISTLEWLHLNKNNLHGDIPLALKNCKELIILDLGENQLSGTIPSWMGETFLSLQILRLRQNKFTGDIPSQLCQLLELQILDLGDNNLIGSIPHCIGDLTRMRSPKGLTELPFTDWNKEDVNQVIKGRELDYANNLKYVVNMDLSSNNLVGAIPDELTTLSGLFGLNLSHNHFVGEIPSKIGEMHSLESLDFCDNQLSGSIPKTMSTLTSLAHLNLSYNKFSGPIPQDNQFITFDTSIYAGNPNLCGDPLPNRCPGDHESSQKNVGANDEDGKETKTEKVLFYLVIAMGFASGFWGFVGVLFFMKSWRHAYFQYIDDAVDNMYVKIAVKVARMKKRMERK